MKEGVTVLAVKIFVYILEALFCLGVIGSVLVVLLAAIDDLKVILPEKETKSPTAAESTGEKHFAY